MEAEGSAIAPWLHTGLFRTYDIGNNPDRVYGPTEKSEITYADCDSSWEVALAQHLDEMPEITRWARNKGLNWSIPYVVDRQQKRYWPDFVAVAPIREGLELNVVIETKGLVREIRPDQETVGPGILGASGQPTPRVRHHGRKAVDLPVLGQRKPLCCRPRRGFLK